MQTIEFHLDKKTPHVELCHLLKLTGIAHSGGQGKLMVANGDVTVDHQLETRKTAKIHAGQAVACQGTRILVVAANSV